MAAYPIGASTRAPLTTRGTPTLLPPFTPGSPMVTAGNGAPAKRPGEFSHVDLGRLARLASMITPKGRGSFAEQAEEALASLDQLLAQQPVPMQVTVQTVFLREAAHQPLFEEMLRRRLGDLRPVISYVLQSPCDGAALALESWAIGGEAVIVKHHAADVLSVEYHGVRWICCGDSQGLLLPDKQGVYKQSLDVIERTRALLQAAGSDLEHVVRTWFYLGEITGEEADTQRYKELNRARTDAYENVSFYCSLLHPSIPHGVYPASTGIGMQGKGLAMTCLALDTTRKDVYLLPLENPQQTPAYAYHPRYSPQSPKFSRAMALVMDDYVTTWISGTASIVNSESCFPDDVEKQTDQTLDNIEKLISRDNFAFHGVEGAGASLKDLAKVRVYVKNPEDFARCKAACERRLGQVPAIYVVADVCRPELLVEIEGVAFARRARA